MTDFFREVDEDYRRDRAAKLFKKFQVPLAVLVVAIIVGAGVWRFYIDRQIATAEEANAKYDAAGKLAQEGKTAEARAAFEALAKEGPTGYAVLSRLRAAEVLAVADKDAAAKALDAIAEDGAYDQALRDTARFRGALIRVDTEDPKAFEQRYGRFVTASFTFHAGMGELLGLAALKRGDFTAAGKYFDAIIVDGSAPSGLRNRAQAYRQLVSAGPATQMTTQAPPLSIEPLDEKGAPMQPPKAPPAGANPAPAAPPAAPPAPPAADQ